MVKLKFIIDEPYLLADAVLIDPYFTIKNREDFMYLRNISDIIRIEREYFFSYKSKISYKIFKSLEQKLKGALKDDGKLQRFYQKILEETQDYKREITAEWSSNYLRSVRMMENITRLEWDDNKEFEVYLIHPSSAIARYLGSNRIVVGMDKEKNNDYTIILWHELMHSKFHLYDSSFSNDISHSIIILVTENELRSRLNGGNYPPFFDSDQDLSIIMKKILPYWRVYLKSERDNILEFERKMQCRMKEFLIGVK